MQTLANHTLLYDEACPLCQWYTGAFVKHGFLDEQGRTQFQAEACQWAPALDMDRARHEIALVERATGHVRYGIDSLFAILQHRWPICQRFFAWKPFRWAISKFYSFISYNRKVIAVDTRPVMEQACQPDFHQGYRLAYLLFAVFLVVVTVTPYADHIVPLIPEAGYGRELVIMAGMLLTQGLLLWRQSWQTRITYWGHMMTVSVIGALLLLPVLFATPLLAWMGLGPDFYVGWLTLVIGLMTAMHWKRVKALQLPGWLTLTWLLFRFLVLLLILL
ncbi:MAG TPA: DUF393 domain-containing protein [Cytophagales bacterium]|nr:DUF393 domain-containing protein [Cytophagales bacterium]HAA23464.1 DUF393 domain-containing protein [Cytophagales bacterium]HAP60659.1 DUF393 domain-containing protein [Cytophagales bacterium]